MKYFRNSYRRRSPLRRNSYRRRSPLRRNSYRRRSPLRRQIYGGVDAIEEDIIEPKEASEDGLLSYPKDTIFISGLLSCIAVFIYVYNDKNEITCFSSWHFNSDKFVSEYAETKYNLNINKNLLKKYPDDKPLINYIKKLKDKLDTLTPVDGLNELGKSTLDKILSNLGDYDRIETILYIPKRFDKYDDLGQLAVNILTKYFKSLENNTVKSKRGQNSKIYAKVNNNLPKLFFKNN